MFERWLEGMKAISILLAFCFIVWVPVFLAQQYKAARIILLILIAFLFLVVVPIYMGSFK